MKTVIQVALLAILTCLLTACGEVRFDIRMQPDKTFAFEEQIILDQKTEIILGKLIPPGPDDFWGLMKKYCESRNFKLKTMASNRLIITGTWPADSPQAAQKFVDDQLTYFMGGYGFKRISNEPLLIGTAAVDRRASWNQHETNIRVPYDTTKEMIKRNFEPPPGAQRVLNFPEVDTIQYKITVHAPYPVSETNGKLEGDKVSWTIPMNKTGEMFVQMRQPSELLFASIGIGVATVVGVVGFLIYRSRRAKPTGS